MADMEQGPLSVERFDIITYHSKKSPTGPTERTPKPEYLIARSQLTERGPLGFGPIQFFDGIMLRYNYLGCLSSQYGNVAFFFRLGFLYKNETLLVVTTEKGHRENAKAGTLRMVAGGNHPVGAL